MGGDKVRAPSGAAARARGILDQTIIAAFASPALAEHARKSLLEHGLKLKELVVVTSARDHALEHVGEFALDVRKALVAGNGIVMVRLDEIDAFEARELLDEDMRSLWTVGTPPVPARSRR